MQIMSINATNKKAVSQVRQPRKQHGPPAGESISADRPQTDTDTDTDTVVWSHKNKKRCGKSEWCAMRCAAYFAFICGNNKRQTNSCRINCFAVSFAADFYCCCCCCCCVHAASCCNIIALARYLSKLAAQPNSLPAELHVTCNIFCRLVVVAMFVLLMCFLPLSFFSPSFLFLFLFLLLFIIFISVFAFFYSLFDNHIPSCSCLPSAPAPAPATPPKNLFHIHRSVR